MKRNSRSNERFQIKPLKIDVSPAEILADLQYGVSDTPTQPNKARRRTR